jgi:hypothetical protein
MISIITSLYLCSLSIVYNLSMHVIFYVPHLKFERVIKNASQSETFIKLSIWLLLTLLTCCATNISK